MFNSGGETMYVNHFNDPYRNYVGVMYPGCYPMHPSYYSHHQAYAYRQQPIRGRAYWTDGGSTTQCGIPWSKAEFMTAAVGPNTNYQCGETLKVRNITNNREVIVTIVDKVPGYTGNQVLLHRKAFETLGVNPSVGVIDVEFVYSPELEQEKWGKYLLEVTQAAYPSYDVTDYNLVNKTVVSSNQTKETYDFILQSPQETIKVRGNVTYNTATDRIVSFDIREL